MASPDGRFVLSYNGETYNHWSLRPALERRFHRRDGISDEYPVALADRYPADDTARLELGRRARIRRLDSGYSTLERVREMIDVLRGVVDAT